MGSIKYCLKNLANFTGRDGRQTFWLYVLVLVIAQFVIGLLVSLPIAADTTKAAIEGVKSGLSEAELQKQVMAGMAGNLKTSMIVSALVTLVAVLMLVAAFVRRLHDSGRPGWIAAIPFALLIVSFGITLMSLDEVLTAMMQVDVNNPLEMAEAQQPLLGANLMSWLSYIIVIVFGLWPSTPGPNRYGEAPARF